MTDRLCHADFLGVWQIRRQVDDKKAVSKARFEGQAEITEGPVLWHYSEAGTLVLESGYRMRAERMYQWKPVAKGFDLFFEDGRDFHTLRFDAPDAAHWCDPDQYNVRYEFGAWPLWRAIWRVCGPRKDYEMTSEMRR